MLIWSISDFPGNSGFCVSSSPKIHPTDHMSMAVEYSWREGKENHTSEKPGRYFHWVVWRLYLGFFLSRTHTTSPTPKSQVSAVFISKFWLLWIMSNTNAHKHFRMKGESLPTDETFFSFLLIKQHSGQTSAFFWQSSCHCSPTEPQFHPDFSYQQGTFYNSASTLFCCQTSQVLD